jgi:hypothetical protein
MNNYTKTFYEYINVRSSQWVLWTNDQQELVKSFMCNYSMMFFK